MLADRVMRGEEGSKLQACHGFSPDVFSWLWLGRKLRGGRTKAIAEVPCGLCGMVHARSRWIAEGVRL